MTGSATEAPVAVVTGGGSGIGRATVLRMARAGYRVVAADLNHEAASATAAMVGEGTVLPLRADVRSEDDIAAMIGTAVERFGRLDVLINNAGVGGAFGALAEIEARDWDFTFEVLVRGVFFGMKHAAPVMGEGGSIVNIASAAASSGSFGPMAYSAAKAAVLSMTRSAAVELAPRFIRVNAVSPGAIRTPPPGSRTA